MTDPAPLDALLAHAGLYAGQGVNHDDQTFKGALELRPVVDEKGLSLTFTATGEDGTVYHQEHSVLGPDSEGAPTLWTLNNNAPGMTTLALRRDGAVEGCQRTLVFGVGDPDAGDTFREEISIDLFGDGRLGYRFAWGLPGGEFAPRSGLELAREGGAPVAEAALVDGEHGKQAGGPGWYVVNMADCPWYAQQTFGQATDLEGQASFRQYGLNVHVLQPGQPNCMYHREDDQEDFLVLSGRCKVLIEEQERELGPWDFVHCPAGTTHVFVGAGEGPCAILMVGGRTPDGGVVYPVSELARRHSAGVETETNAPPVAYAPFPKWSAVKSPWPLNRT